MRFTLARLRFRRSRPPARDDRVERALDRSRLLAELEVSVPAPERIVGWEQASRTPAGRHG